MRCSTLVLVVLFAATGWSTWAEADHGLLPALMIFIGLAVYALYGRDKRGSSECCGKA